MVLIFFFTLVSAIIIRNESLDKKVKITAILLSDSQTSPKKFLLIN